MADSNDDFHQLWRQAIENHVINMTPAEFAALETKRSESNFTSKDFKDPADRQRAIMASINAKQARSNARGPADANGYRPGQHPSDTRHPH